MKLFYSLSRKVISLIVLFAITISLSAQNGSLCYKPMSGAGVTANAYTSGLLCLACGNGELNKLTDADRNNYVEMNQLVGLLQGNELAVTDSANTYAAGFYAGYVVDIGASLLTINALNSFVISTYNNGQLMETFSGSGLITSPLTGSNIGKSYLYAKTNQPFDEVRFGLNAGVGALSTVQAYYAMAFDPNCGTLENNAVCDDPIQGAGTVVTFNGGLVCALCNLNNPGNLIDADKNNYALLTTTVGAVASPSVGVLDEQNIYPAGYRAGFVIEPDQSNALLDANVLNGLVVETYLFGTLQESKTFNSGAGVLSVSALSMNNQAKTKLEFTTTLKFNEVRLRVNQTVGVSLGGLRVYYAFEEPPTCTDCQEALTTGRTAPFTGRMVTGSGWTGAYGLSLLGGGTLTNTSNVVTDNLTDYARYQTATLSLLGTGVNITVDNSPTGSSSNLFPAGTFGGFLIEKEGGLLDVNLLSALTVSLYNGTTLVGTKSGSSLLGAGLLTVSGGKTVVGFNSTAAFNRIKLNVDNGLLAVGLLGSSYRFYYAFVIQDVDNDGTPDCVDNCIAGPNSTDIDGDGTPDACDDCNVGTAPPLIGATTFANECPITTVDLSVVTATNLLPSTKLSFHTATPATTANQVANIFAVGAGTYFAAINDTVNNCFGVTVEIRINATACSPLAEADHTATLINTAVNGNLSTNDSDPQNLTLTYNSTPSIAPANAAVTINADGTFTYTPNQGFVGNDNFQYTVCNAAQLCATAWVHITVFNPAALNTGALIIFAQDDYSQTLVGIPVNGNASSNDLNPGNIALSYTLIDNAKNGQLQMQADGSYVYTPNVGTIGVDTARYRVCDSETSAVCSEAFIVVKVNEDKNGSGNNPPFAQNDVASTSSIKPVTGNVLSNDSDPDGDALSASAIDNLPSGLVLNSDGTFSYTAPEGFKGSITVPYSACDGAGACDTATLVIVVYAVKRPDLTPSLRVASTGFTPSAQTERNVVINVNEIAGGKTISNIAPIQVRVIKSDNFNFSFDSATTSTTIFGPVPVSNPRWELSINNETQMLFTLKPGYEISANGISSFVIRVKVKQTASTGNDNLNVTIIHGSGGEIEFSNNQVIRVANVY